MISSTRSALDRELRRLTLQTLAACWLTQGTRRRSSTSPCPSPSGPW
ncbi:MAG: hypothetical protein VKO26_03570 [Cyanobacteriota bacterium]|nr:hypothetical protein [Cyanobacteriota bacterium]